MLAPSAALGDSAARNSVAKRIPANTTGTENTTTAIIPTTVGDPPIRSHGNQYEIANPATKPAQIQNGGQPFPPRSTTAFASNKAISNAEMTIPFTCQTVPKNSANRVIPCGPRKKKPPPNPKKNS